MEKIKAKLTAEPVNRPPLAEWVKEFKFGSQGKPLMEALGRADTTGNPNLMNGYDFSKLKR
jgi:hypothetical protein